MYLLFSGILTCKKLPSAFTHTIYFSERQILTNFSSETSDLLLLHVQIFTLSFIEHLPVRVFHCCILDLSSKPSRHSHDLFLCLFFFLSCFWSVVAAIAINSHITPSQTKWIEEQKDSQNFGEVFVPMTRIGKKYPKKPRGRTSTKPDHYWIRQSSFWLLRN